MKSTHLTVVGNANFDAVVLNSQVPVVVDFWAPWCGPCRLLGPVLAKFAVDYAGKLTIAKLNTDENKADENYVGARYNVGGIPHVAFFAAGEHVTDLIGFTPYENYKPLFEKELAKLGIEPVAVDPEKEATFATAVAAAMERYEAAFADIQARMDVVFNPIEEGIGARVKEARAQVKAGEMAEADLEPLVTEYREAQGAAFAPFRDEYKAISAAASDAYETDVAEAVAAYASTSPAESTDAGTAPAGVVCEDGVCRIG